MKRLILTIFLLCVASPSYAGSLITATITVTNTPADGDTITVNASARTWKTTVATPVSQILIGASIGANATNLFNQFAGNGFTTLSLDRSGTNGVTLRGVVDQTITISIAGTWGSYSLSTNTTTTSYVVQVPASSHPTQSRATNIISTLASDLGTYSTNALAAGTTLVGNLVQTTGTQSVAGAKTFSGANTYSNTSQLFSGGSTTNLTIGSPSAYITNLYAYGPIRITNTSPSLTFYDSDGAADNKALLFSLNNGDLTVSIESDDFGTATAVMNINRTGNTLDNITFPSAQVVVNQLTGELSGNLTNTVQYSGGPAMQTVSSLANGNNAAVPTSGYEFIKLTAGPTGVFTINGLAGGGVRRLTIYNATGQNMTIAHQSGTDPVATNRIVSLTGADQSTTADGAAGLVYDTTASRWILLWISP
jgi:hypothetical protein